GLMIIIFQELKQNWVVKVRLNIEFLQPRKLLKVSSNIWGSLHGGFFCGGNVLHKPSSSG
ncbi:hypothetical protein, partial [Latilactobacillus curvatus]|uniref:hypothetical protein n=1 Tax=Latilactobacillus curvatus TaxID=28038 RepID=UPI003889B4FD